MRFRFLLTLPFAIVISAPCFHKAAGSAAWVTRQVSTVSRNNQPAFFSPWIPLLRTGKVALPWKDLGIQSGVKVERRSIDLKRCLRSTRMHALPKEIEVMEGKIEVLAAPSEVYTVASGFKDYPKWVAGVRDVSFNVQSDERPPDLVSLDMKLFGLQHVNTLKFDFEKGRKLSWTMTDGGVKAMNGSYDFQPLPNGHTEVTFHLAIDPGFPVPGMLKRMATKAFVKTALKDLKRYTERNDQGTKGKVQNLALAA